MITKDMKIIEVLQVNRATAAVFSSYGMGCVGCLAARGETVEEAAKVHGINLQEMLAKLNAVAK